MARKEDKFYRGRVKQEEDPLPLSLVKIRMYDSLEYGGRAFEAFEERLLEVLPEINRGLISGGFNEEYMDKARKARKIYDVMEEIVSIHEVSSQDESLEILREDISKLEGMLEGKESVTDF